MQEARRVGVTVVSLVDRKELTAYLEDPDATSPFVEATSQSAPCLSSFDAVDRAPKTAVKESRQDTQIPSNFANYRPAIAIDPTSLGSKSFARIMQIGKRALDQENESGGTTIDSVPTSAAGDDKSIAQTSLVDQMALANQPASLIAKQDLANPKSSSDLSTGVPIIIVPASPSSLLGMLNAPRFLGPEATFESASEAKARGIRKDNSLFIEHRLSARDASIRVQITDNPLRLTLEEWSRVAAVFVQGQAWQFKGWRWESPAELFYNVPGFFLHYADQPLPDQILTWNVTRLSISKSRRHFDSTAALTFWSTVESHLRSKHMIR
jgi:hypothetical protein